MDIIASNATVFVIDDDEVVRDSLKVLLESRNYTVVDFDSGSQFLNNRTNHASKACLVVDVHMPDMTGLELLRNLRNRGDAIPAILITGRTDAGVQEKAKELGAIALLDKPVSHQVLFAAIGQALSAPAAR
jgi:FixJ family two-component response regulator